jgi:hypothetical protein
MYTSGNANISLLHEDDRVKHGWSYELEASYMDDLDLTHVDNDVGFKVAWTRKVMGFQREWGPGNDTDNFDWTGVYQAWARNTPDMLTNTRLMDVQVSASDIWQWHMLVHHFKSFYPRGLISYPGMVFNPGHGYYLDSGTTGNSMKPLETFGTRLLVSDYIGSDDLRRVLDSDRTRDKLFGKLMDGDYEGVFVSNGPGFYIEPVSVETSYVDVNGALVTKTFTGRKTVTQDSFGRKYMLPQFTHANATVLSPVFPDDCREPLPHYSFVSGNHCRTWARGSVRYLTGTSNVVEFLKKYRCNEFPLTALDRLRRTTKHIGVSTTEMES